MAEPGVEGSDGVLDGGLLDGDPDVGEEAHEFAARGRRGVKEPAVLGHEGGETVNAGAGAAQIPFPQRKTVDKGEVVARPERARHFESVAVDEDGGDRWCQHGTPCLLYTSLEPTKRGVYGGVVGYIDFSGNLDTAIAIRTLSLIHI